MTVGGNDLGGYQGEITGRGGGGEMSGGNALVCHEGSIRRSIAP